MYYERLRVPEIHLEEICIPKERRSMKEKIEAPGDCECVEAFISTYNDEGEVIKTERNPFKAHDCEYIALRHSLSPIAAAQATEIYPPRLVGRKKGIEEVADSCWVKEYFSVMDRLVKEKLAEEGKEEIP